MIETDWESYQGANVYAVTQAAAAQNIYLDGAKIIVFRETASAGEIIVVTAIAPWAATIIGPGLGSEEKQYISPKNGDGFFLFEPRLNNQKSKLSSSVVLSAWQNQASGTIDDSKTSSGVTMITETPRDCIEAGRQRNNARFIVSPGQTLTVLFSLVPDAIAGALDQRYAIGGAPPLKSVNYAGIAMAGKRMPADHFEKVKKQRGWE